MSTFEKRFLQRAAQNPQAFARAVQSNYGFEPNDVAKLLSIASRLSQNSGALLTPRDTRVLQELHRHVPPQQIATLTAELNKLPPAMRATSFMALLADDAAAVKGDFVNAGETYKQVESLARDYMKYEMVEAVNAKRGGVDVEARHKPEEGSVREYLSRQFQSPVRRELNDAMKADDWNPEILLEPMAAKMEDAANRLEREDASARDTVAAAYDWHQGEALAKDTFGD